MKHPSERHPVSQAAIDVGAALMWVVLIVGVPVAAAAIFLKVLFF